MSGFIQKSSFAALAVLACLGASASAADYQYHHKVNGLVKAAPPAPPCVDAKNAPAGEISTQFCGSEGIELYNAGVVGDHAVLYGLTDDSSSVQWSNIIVNVPGVPECYPRSNCLGYTDGKAYTAAMLAHDSSRDLAVKACGDKGEGWYLPAYAELVPLYRQMNMANFARLGLSGSYWASVEGYTNGDGAWLQRFPTDTDTLYAKSNSNKVRCARSG